MRSHRRSSLSPPTPPGGGPPPTWRKRSGAATWGRALRRVAWCTGGAQGFIEQAIAMGVDAYFSGEISEPTVHAARESGVHYWAMGHHASERYGVQALGEWCARELGLTHHFVDIDNPA